MGKLRPNTRYAIEPDAFSGTSWNDMSATELQAIVQWTAECASPDLTQQDMAYYTQLAKSFKWGSRARNEILDGVAAYRYTYSL